MKKNFKYAILSAIAFVGAVSFSACSSSEDVVDNPDYNPETNTVKVQIAISLQDNIAKTRMSSNAVQSTGTIAQFLGMKDIKLIPYHKGTGVIASNDNILEGAIIGLSNIDAVSSGTATEANKVYSDVAVPLTADRFLLYGYAGQTAGFDNGDLTVAGLSSGTATNVDGVTFTPVSIVTSTDQTTNSRTFKNLLQLLNRVAGTTSGTTTWAPGTSQTTVAALVSLYNSFSRITLGSSQYVKEALEDLYNGVNTAAQDENAPGHDLAVAIQDNIKNALSYTESTGTSTTTISCAANTVSGSILTLSSDYTGYPASANLPEGAPRIAYNSTSKEFEDATSHSIGSVNATNLENYVYPANLQYFVESDIMTEKSKVLDGSISTFTAAQALYTGATAGTEVAADTRSILLNKQIQYGVGRLDATVNALSGTKYFDNVGNLINVSAGYTLTGILIGDQKAVGWNFVQSGGTPYTIYDKKIAGGTTGSAVTTTAASATNYTLVLETTDDTPVNVALEFTNNGADFVGADGIIPAGATFYLVGTLTPTSGLTNYGEGEGKTKKVFAQDFVTTATFTIGTGASSSDPETYGGTPAGFGEAHIGLPDLTMPSMELGLSVDLSWTPGLVFNDVPLGQ